MDKAEVKQSEPVIVEACGMRIWVDHRKGVGGDEGLTFDITRAGDADGERILRFDCFSKTPHYHVGSAPKSPVHDMIAEGIKDPVRWTLAQLQTNLASLLVDAGHAELAEGIDQQAIARSLAQVENDIIAKL